MEAFLLSVLIVFAYFFGNISFARIISRFKHKDITKMGSGNPGTMNMLRTSGVKAGALTLLLDVLKGAFPCLIAYIVFAQYGEVMQMIALYSCGLAVIIGHIYPICYKFKGGKGVATGIGVFLVANPLCLVLIMLLAFIYLWVFDYGSIASFIVISTMIIIQGFSPVTSQNIAIPILLLLIFTTIFFAHRSNIYRLLVGKENKVNLQNSIKKQLGNKKKQTKELYKQEIINVKIDFNEEKLEFKETKQNIKQSKNEFNKINADTEYLDEEFKHIKDEYKIKKARYKQDISSLKQSYKNEKKQLKKDLSNNEIVKTTITNIPNKDKNKRDKS